MDTVNILGVGIAKTNLKNALNFVVSSKNCVVYNVNADIVYKAYKDSEFLGKLNKANLILAEDSLLHEASKTLKNELPEKVDISLFVDSIIKYAYKEKKSVYLLGSKAGVALKAKQKLETKYRGINIIDSQSTKYDEEKKSDILILDLPSPIREEFIEENIDKISSKTIIAFTGSLPYLAGLTKKAPNWYRRFKLEKLYEKMSSINSVDDIVFIPHFKKAVSKQKKEK